MGMINYETPFQRNGAEDTAIFKIHNQQESTV